MSATPSEHSKAEAGMVEGGPAGPNEPEALAAHHRQYRCSSCGAELEFKPGTTALNCPYCAAKNTIEGHDASAAEIDFRAELERLEGQAESHDEIVLKCESCAAEVRLGPNVSSNRCAFCGSPVVATGRSTKLIRPNAILPFEVDERTAREKFRAWIHSRWFAPGALKDQARIEAGLQGVYLPYWTYDSKATTAYTGMRGDAYYVTQTYTVTVNGRPQVRTRRVRHIRWSPAAGTVHNSFDDVLVPAAEAIKPDRQRALEPWDLKRTVAYRDEFLSGFRAETYTVPLRQGFDQARERMQPTIDATIRAHIGGDEQRITSSRSNYRDITFKHLLLPVWLFAYRWNNKPYQVTLNARTGEVLGERPYSTVKIVFAVLGALLGVIISVAIFAAFGGR